MVDIETILVRIYTAPTGSGGGGLGYSGTDGDVYVGIGGREFSIDSYKDDFESAQDRTFVLGKGPDPPMTGYASNPSSMGSPVNTDIQGIRNRGLNDPQRPYKLKTENLYKYPVYLRFEPKDRDDNWLLSYVSVFVNPRGREPFIYEEATAPSPYILWLGTHYAKYCYLHQISPPVPASLPNGTRGL